MIPSSLWPLSPHHYRANAQAGIHIHMKLILPTGKVTAEATPSVMGQEGLEYIFRAPHLTGNGVVCSKCAYWKKKRRNNYTLCIMTVYYVVPPTSTCAFHSLRASFSKSGIRFPLNLHKSSCSLSLFFSPPDLSMAEALP